MRNLVTGVALAVISLLGASAASAAEDCRNVHSEVSFCESDDTWSRLEKKYPEGLAIFSGALSSVGKVIVERAAGGAVTRKSVETAILRNLVLRQGGADRSFKIDRLEGSELDGHMIGNLQYQLPGKNRNLLTLHSYIVIDNLVVQVITVTQDKVSPENARNLHRDFLGHLQFGAPETLL